MLASRIPPGPAPRPDSLPARVLRTLFLAILIALPLPSLADDGLDAYSADYGRVKVIIVTDVDADTRPAFGGTAPAASAPAARPADVATAPWPQRSAPASFDGDAEGNAGGKAMAWPPASALPQQNVRDIALVPAADLTTSPANLWTRIRNGFAMPDLDHPAVRIEEDFYASRPDYVGRIVERSRRYLFHIVEALEARGMPSELALLPIIESAYNPGALSHAQAAGMWQFIPSTGLNFGLRQNWWLDSRRDILLSTEAALDYLQKLYDMFGSWELALAAYNCGEGCVQRAIARNALRGDRVDFVSLSLPPETRSYVPKLQAVKNIIADPKQYGLNLAAVLNEPYFGTVRVDQHMDVKVAAKLAGVSLEEFTALNPAHRRSVINANKLSTLLLPLDRINRFEAGLRSAGDAKLVSMRIHTPRAGESLDQIAKRYSVAPAALRQANEIPPRVRTAVAGVDLMIPTGGAAAAAAPRRSAPLAAPAARRAPARATTAPSATTTAAARRAPATVRQVTVRQETVRRVSAPTPPKVPSARRNVPATATSTAARSLAPARVVPPTPPRRPDVVANRVVRASSPLSGQ